MLYWNVLFIVMGSWSIIYWFFKYSDEVVSSIFEELKVCIGIGEFVFF